MSTDTRISLPPAKYLVEQVVEGRKHLYRVTHDNGSKDSFPGVTGVLSSIAKPALYQWYARMATENAEKALMGQLDGKKSKTIKLTEEWIKEIIAESKKTPEKLKDEAASLGTEAHAYFEAYCRGEAPAPATVNPLIRPSVERFLKWIETSGLVVVAGDTKVASLRHRFGGALDAILCVEDASKTPPELGLGHGDFVLGDYKSSNGIYDEYALQISAYSQALSETHGIDCRAGVIIRFGKDQKKDALGNPMPLDFEQKWLRDQAKSFKTFLHAKALQEGLKQDNFLDECDN